MSTDEITLTFTREQVENMIGWAGMAGVGFVYGGTPDPKDPGVMALAELTAAVAPPSTESEASR